MIPVSLYGHGIDRKSEVGLVFPVLGYMVIGIAVWWLPGEGARWWLCVLMHGASFTYLVAHGTNCSSKLPGSS